MLSIHRGLIEKHWTDPLRRDLLRALQELGAQGADLDECVIDLARRNRGALSAVYDLARELCSFHDLCGAPPLLDAVRTTLGVEALHMPFQHTVFRIDLPEENWRGFGWHQDFAYNMLGRTSLTMWTPLTSTDEHNGSVEVAAAESMRVYPIEVRWKRDPEGRIGSGRDAFIAPRFHAAFERAAEAIPLEVGDVMLFGPLMVHRSGHNRGPKPRVSIQVRYGHLFAPEMIERQWAHRRQDGFHTFKALYPELVELEEEA